MKDIGGYFGLEKLISNEYYKDLIPLNSGRNSLLYILKARDVRKLYIPSYLCDSISDTLKMHGYNFEFYNIGSDFMPIFNEKLYDREYLYVVNYYGQLSNSTVLQLLGRHKRVILDNAQAFFQKPIKNIDTIYTCRKFFGVPDGAYLSSDARIKDDLEVDVSKDRMTHILGRYEGIAPEYFIHYQNNEENFIREPLKFMSMLTHNILGAIDYQKVCSIRTENYSYLHNKLGKYNKLILNIPSGAFAYPFYIEDGIKIRSELVKHKMYIPTLWPNVLSEAFKGTIEYDYSANILPLPCDQRYTFDDMNYMVKQVLDLI